jgi:hypothetical protein
MSSLIWPECRVSEGSIGELPSVPYAWRLLDRMRFDCVHPCFFWTVWLWRERHEAPLFVAIRGIVLVMVKSDAENIMDARI